MHYCFKVIAIGLIAASSMAQAASSKNVEMLDVQCSYAPKYRGKLAAMVADAVVSGFQYTDSGGRDLKYSIDDIRRGVVLVNALGKDLVHVISPDFDPESGGTLKLTFHRRFFSDDRRVLYLIYNRELSGDWILRTDDQQGRDPFDAVMVNLDTTIGVPSGIRDIILKFVDQVEREYDPKDLPRAPQSAEMSRRRFLLSR